MSKYDEMENVFGEGTIFHGGFQYLGRLNVLLWTCNNASMKNDIPTWYNALLTLYRELYPKMKDDKKKAETVTELDSAKTLMEGLNKAYDDYQCKYNQFIQNRRVMKTIQFIPPRNIFKYLHEFEMLLRKIMNRTGMLMPEKDNILPAMRV